jgi:hypothetical protein
MVIFEEIYSGQYSKVLVEIIVGGFDIELKNSQKIKIKINQFFPENCS